MKRHDWADEYDLRLYRKSIETVNSQLESMGLERLRAHTNGGFDIRYMHRSSPCGTPRQCRISNYGRLGHAERAI